MRCLLIYGILLVLWMATVPQAGAQASARYNISKSSISGGGIIFSGSTRYRLGSTLGQPLIAGPNSLRFRINGGFWNVPAQYLFVTKLSTGSDLTLGPSWTGGTPPNSENIAAWSANSLGSGLTLNSPMSWGGMSILGGTSDIRINGSGPLAISAAGIDMSSSPINLAMNLPINLDANQTWNINSDQSLTMFGVVSGNYGLAKSGGGSLILTNANNYVGATAVNEGLMALDYNPGDTSTGTLAGGTMITVNHCGTLLLGVEDALGYSGGIPAQLNINGGLVTSASVANANPVQSGGASFRVTLPALAFTGGTLSSGSNNVGDLYGGSYLLGSITTLACSNTAVINADSLSLLGSTFLVAAGSTPSGVDLYVSSILEDWMGNPASLVKGGPGLMMLNNANTYTGGTTVNGGVLALDYNPGDNPTGTLAAGTTLTVNNGGTLRLDGEDVLGFYSGSLAQLNIKGGLVTTANVPYPTPVQYGGTSFRVTLPVLTFTGGTLSSGTNIFGDAYGGSYLVGPVNTLASPNPAVINAYSVSIQNSTFTVAAGTTASGVDLDVSSILNNWVGAPQSLTKTGNGLMALDAANTYSGPTTVSAGTLALRGNGSIADSPSIIIAGGAVFDVSALNGVFPLATGQMLGNLSSTGIIKGNASAANGTLSLKYTNGSPALEITSGTLTLTTNTAFAITNLGSQLPVGIYPIIVGGLGGTVAGAVTSGVITVGGGGTARAALLTIANGELYLVVGNPVNLNPTSLTLKITGQVINLSWPADHLGWTLQTNSVGLTATNQWFPFPGSTTATNVSIDVEEIRSSVFFRLAYLFP
jgi:autotransporter-associated beta strand protein